MSRPILWALGPVLVAASLVDARAEPTVAVPTVETLVERVSTAWDSLNVKLTAGMTVVRPNRPDTEVELLIRRAGRGRTRIDFLSPPKDEGKVLLQIGDESWLYLPRADRFVEVLPRRNPLAGGVLFEDLFPGRPAVSGAVVEELDDGWVLVIGAPEKKKKETSRIYFDRSTLLPFRRETYGSSGRLLKTVHIEETRKWHGVEIPWKVRFVDNLGSGIETRIEVLRADELEGDLEALFSRERLEPSPRSETPGER